MGFPAVVNQIGQVITITAEPTYGCASGGYVLVSTGGFIIVSGEARQEGDQQPPVKLSTSEKVELFQMRFKGRQDVFAHRWQNSKGRSGYSFACNNEWLQGVCNKPRIKCNDCPNREYITQHNQVIYDHLAGKHIVGLYPLLSDNTCHLLAADFDKDGWRETVQAMARACRQKKTSGQIDIATYQSLINKKENTVDALIPSYAG
jgi:hypothetical protein